MEPEYHGHGQTGFRKMNPNMDTVEEVMDEFTDTGSQLLKPDTFSQVSTDSIAID